MENLQWIYVVIVAPLLGAIGGGLRSWYGEWRAAKRRKKRVISRLSGLPLESKAVLIDFYQNGTHTSRADPGYPAVKVLIHSGFLTVGPGGGTHDAIDRYLTIKPEVWEVMECWIAVDAASIARAIEVFLEPVEHDSTR